MNTRPAPESCSRSSVESCNPYREETRIIGILNHNGMTVWGVEVATNNLGGGGGGRGEGVSISYLPGGESTRSRGGSKKGDLAKL